MPHGDDLQSEAVVYICFLNSLPYQIAVQCFPLVMPYPNKWSTVRHRQASHMLRCPRQVVVEDARAVPWLETMTSWRKKKPGECIKLGKSWWNPTCLTSFEGFTPRFPNHVKVSKSYPNGCHNSGGSYPPAGQRKKGFVEPSSRRSTHTLYIHVYN